MTLPKFHPEISFIKLYWSEAKRHTCARCVRIFKIRSFGSVGRNINSKHSQICAVLWTRMKSRDGYLHCQKVSRAPYDPLLKRKSCTGRTRRRTPSWNGLNKKTFPRKLACLYCMYVGICFIIIIILLYIYIYIYIILNHMFILWWMIFKYAQLSRLHCDAVLNVWRDPPLDEDSNWKESKKEQSTHQLRYDISNSFIFEFL